MYRHVTVCAKNSRILFVCLSMTLGLMAASASAQPDTLLPNTFGTCTNSGNAICDTTVNTCPSGATCDPCGQVRYLSFKIPGTDVGMNTAIRIRLTSLHNPVPAPVGAVPSYDVIEGGFRYLNTVPGSLSRCCDPNYNYWGICQDVSCGSCSPPFVSCYQGECCLPPDGASASCDPNVSCSSDADCAGLGVNTKCEKQLCPDSAAYGTFFRCGLIGCTPEYRDWSDFSGLVTYATGSTVIPSSVYGVSQLDAVCAGNEAECAAASPELMISTERWGNLDCSNVNGGIPNASDLGRIVDKVKDIVGAYIKPRVHIAAAQLDPLSGMGAQHIAREVDAVKGHQYPFNINCTTTESCTSDNDCDGPRPCSANGYCTSIRDSCSGLCQP